MTFSPRRKPFSERLLAAFLRPPVARPLTASIIVVTAVIAIGVGDYFSHIGISLSLFYLVPVSLAAAWLGARSAAALAVFVTSVRLGGDYLSHGSALLPAHTIWNVLAALPILLFVVWLINSLVELHWKLEGKVSAQSDQLRDSAADRERLEMELLEVSARERSAFGRELHDELGQHFFATSLAAQTLAEKLAPRSEAAEMNAIVHWIEEGIAKMRKLARGLLLAQIEPTRLAQELEELAISASRGSVRCRMIHEGDAVKADAWQCAQLFRIAQEAVGNALRHARPHHISIDLVCDSQALNLTIEDDGCGMPRDRANGSGMGLRIMEHRARVIGATLAVEARAAGGTCIRCRLGRKQSPA